MIITAENDVLRDEGEAYARKLIEAGVHVACVRYNNTHHDFMMLNALAETTPTRAAGRRPPPRSRKCCTDSSDGCAPGRSPSAAGMRRP